MHEPIDNGDNGERYTFLLILGSGEVMIMLAK